MRLVPTGGGYYRAVGVPIARRDRRADRRQAVGAANVRPQSQPNPRDALAIQLASISAAGFHPISPQQANNIADDMGDLVEQRAREGALPIVLVGVAAAIAVKRWF